MEESIMKHLRETQRVFRLSWVAQSKLLYKFTTTMTYDRCARHDLYQDTHWEGERDSKRMNEKEGDTLRLIKIILPACHSRSVHVNCCWLRCKEPFLLLGGKQQQQQRQQQNVAYYVAATAIKRHITANKRVSQLSETIISNNHKGCAIVVFF